MRPLRPELCVRGQAPFVAFLCVCGLAAAALVTDIAGQRQQLHELRDKQRVAARALDAAQQQDHPAAQLVEAVAAYRLALPKSAEPTEAPARIARVQEAQSVLAALGQNTMNAAQLADAPAVVALAKRLAADDSARLKSLRPLDEGVWQLEIECAEEAATPLLDSLTRLDAPLALVRLHMRPSGESRAGLTLWLAPVKLRTGTAE